MSDTMFDPSDQLDHDHIRAAAEWAAQQLAANGVARVRITPGDMTEYPILVVRPGMEWQQTAGRTVEQNSIYYWVVVCADFGAAYEWPGGDVHPRYAYEKWTSRASKRGSRGWTAHVVAEFLTGLSDALHQIGSVL